MRFKSPCLPDCVNRSAICHSVCEEWKKYEEERNKRYAEKIERNEAELRTHTKKRKRW